MSLQGAARPAPPPPRSRRARECRNARTRGRPLRRPPRQRDPMRLSRAPPAPYAARENARTEPEMEPGDSAPAPPDDCAGPRRCARPEPHPYDAAPAPVPARAQPAPRRSPPAGRPAECRRSSVRAATISRMSSGPGSMKSPASGNSESTIARSDTDIAHRLQLSRHFECDDAAERPAEQPIGTLLLHFEHVADIGRRHVFRSTRQASRRHCNPSACKAVYRYVFPEIFRKWRITEHRAAGGCTQNRFSAAPLFLIARCAAERSRPRNDAARRWSDAR